MGAILKFLKPNRWKVGSVLIIIVVLYYYHPLNPVTNLLLGFCSKPHGSVYLEDGQKSGGQSATVQNLKMNPRELGKFLSDQGWDVNYKLELGNFWAIRTLYARKAPRSLLPVHRIWADISYYDVFDGREDKNEFQEWHTQYGIRKGFIDIDTFYQNKKYSAKSRRFVFTFIHGHEWEGEAEYSSIAKQLNARFGIDLPEDARRDLSYGRTCT